MVKDRPEMGRYVRKEDPIWQYCARQYGGEAIGEHIVWNNTQPLDRFNASHIVPHHGKAGQILVAVQRAGAARANNCEELWLMATYELFNIRNHTRQDAVWEAALSGEIDRTEYIRRTALLEYEAFPYLAAAYKALWKPAVEAKGIKTTPSEWGLTLPGTGEEWLKQYGEPRPYPWGVYGKNYDEAMLSLLRARPHNPLSL